MNKMRKAIMIMDKRFIDLVYPAHVLNEIKSLVEFVSEPLLAEEVQANPAVLNEVEFIFSSWGGLKLDEEMLDAAPNLAAVFYGAGSIRNIVTDELWNRDIKITDARMANAVPVAEFTLSQILFTLKSGYKYIKEIKHQQTYPKRPLEQIAGNYKSVVGMIGMSSIGRKVREHLQNFDLDVVVSDPYLSDEEANKLQVKKVSLAEVFEMSDVVSLHAPLLTNTENLITGKHFDMMKPNTSFINTSRGKIVKQDEMIEVLKRRTDITAVLDVVYPEPPEKGSKLYMLENIILTPHIAGSEGEECGRMGEYMLGELKRYLNAEPLLWEVTKEAHDLLA